MKLNLKSIADAGVWTSHGYELPLFDPEETGKRAQSEPQWIHFGAGNIFRSFPAALMQGLLDRGLADRGMIAVEGFDPEIIDRIYAPHDNLSLLVSLNADGSVRKKIIGSVSEALVMDRKRAADFEKLKAYFRSDSLQAASFTITEKGYATSDANGRLFKHIEADLEAGPEKSASYMGLLCSLIYERFKAGEKPLALVSMDNFSHNGEKLKEAVFCFAEGWRERGFVPEGFVEYLSEPDKVSFPWSMIDKITPRPDPAVAELLERDGFEDGEIIVTAKNTYISAFVNAEKAQYLVIEDSFPNGRPPFEESGVIFCDRETVNKVEKMKVCTCLNPLHTALAVFGCLLGYEKISDEMRDPVLRSLVFELGYREALPVVSDPGIIDPEGFISEVLNERIPNPFMPDTPQRIATDSSQKIPVRFGETIKAYMAEREKDLGSLKVIPLVLAAWLRYLLAVDDRGRAFQPSPDPLYPELSEQFKGISFDMLSRESGAEEDMAGRRAVIEERVRKLLSNEKIFAVDLNETVLADKIMELFCEMLCGRGAVRACLERCADMDYGR